MEQQDGFSFNDEFPPGALPDDPPGRAKKAAESQEERILEYLERGNTLTPLEALNDFGCFRLAAVIWKLKGRGIKIRTNMVSHGDKTFAQYSLIY